jgi:hypothetical protein
MGMKMAHVELGGLDFTEPSVKMMMSCGGIFSARELKMMDVSCGLIEAADLWRGNHLDSKRGETKGVGEWKKV